MRNNFADFLGKVSADAWVQSFGTLLGSFLGALLAGGFAILVLNSQVKAEEKKSLQDEFNRFMKFYEKYMKNLSPMLGNFRVIERKISEKEWNLIKESNDINVDILPDLLKVDTSELIHSSEAKVNMINRELELVTFQLSLYSYSNNPLHLEHFLDNLRSVREKVKDLEEHKEKIHRQVNK